MRDPIRSKLDTDQKKALAFLTGIVALAGGSVLVFAVALALSGQNQQSSLAATSAFVTAYIGCVSVAVRARRKNNGKQPQTKQE